MARVMLAKRYDDNLMGYGWYMVVEGVSTQGFYSPWDAVVAGLGFFDNEPDRLDFLWDAALCLSALYGEPSIRIYKKLLNLIGEK